MTLYRRTGNLAVTFTAYRPKLASSTTTWPFCSLGATFALLLSYSDNFILYGPYNFTSARTMAGLSTIRSIYRYETKVPRGTVTTSTWYRYEVRTRYKGVRCYGLALACGSAHARNGRECRLIETVNATQQWCQGMPRGALRNCHV